MLSESMETHSIACNKNPLHASVPISVRARLLISTVCRVAPDAARPHQDTPKRLQDASQAYGAVVSAQETRKMHQDPNTFKTTAKKYSDSMTLSAQCLHQCRQCNQIPAVNDQDHTCSNLQLSAIRRSGSRMAAQECSQLPPNDAAHSAAASNQVLLPIAIKANKSDHHL